MKRVYILRGLPGSGKSSLANVLNMALWQTGYSCSICSADNYHIDQNGNYNWKPENVAKAHQYCRDLFLLDLKRECECIIIDNTNTQHKEYAFYIETAKKYGYSVTPIIVGNFDEAAIQQSVNRNVHKVPEAQIRKMAERFQY